LWLTRQIPKLARLRWLPGLTDAIGVEILEGIEAGDCVVIGDYDALNSLVMGKQVRLGKVK